MAFDHERAGWRMTIGLAVLAAIAVRVSDIGVPDHGLSADPEIIQEIVTYAVSGETVAQLENDRDRRGPKHLHEDQQWSGTRGFLVIDWVNDAGAPCGSRPEVTIAVQTIVPAIHRSPAALVEGFGPFRDALERHEREHAVIWNDAARQLRDGIAGIDEDHCLTRRRRVQAALDATREAVGRRHAQLDATTRDGITEGAALELTDDLMRKQAATAVTEEIIALRVSWVRGNTVDRWAASEGEIELWNDCLRTATPAPWDHTLDGTYPDRWITFDTGARERNLALSETGVLAGKGRRAWYHPCVADLFAESRRAWNRTELVKR